MQTIRFNVLFLALLCLFASSCSTKKNTSATRQWRAFTTRYNIYFNGNEAYKEALSGFEKSYQDDYSERIYLHPVSSLSEKEGAANAGFDRAIEKSQKAIKLRSMSKRPAKNARKSDDPDYKAFLKRTEFNPFLHNAWLLMGKSQFYKGDFLGANSTFLYITRHFAWLPETVTESQLWMARCYTEMGWLYEAENMISKIDPKTVPAALSGWYHTVMASYLIHKDATKEAIPSLEIAIRHENNRAQKARMKFLLAQLYAENDDPVKAYKYYGDVMKMNPSYRTYFNAGIRQTEVMPKQDGKKIEKKLNRMQRDPRNKEFLDQIYYAKGNLYLQNNDTLKAIDAYQKAVSESTRNGMEKAVAAIRLGDITFAREEYLKAQPAYGAAAAILSEKHRDYQRINHISQVLDNLSTHAETVHLQDSLLTLAAMPEAERMKAIQTIIDRLIEQEKKEEEAARREEYENNKGNYEQPDQNMPTTPSINTGDNSWYFFNTQSVNSGKTEFQRKWGARKPEDNWRRRDKSHVFMDEQQNPAQEEENVLAENGQQDNSTITAGEPTEVQSDSLSSDPRNPDYYLKQIPFTSEAKETSHELIREGLFNMAQIFNQQLENLPVSIKTYRDLENRYPDNQRSLEIYYEIYLMYMRLGDEPNANNYKQQILSKYPESAYAVALRNPDYIRNLREMEQKQNEFYEQTYQAYLEGNRSKVHQNYAFVTEKWPLCKLMPNFLFLHALSFIGDNDSKAFRENLEKLTALYGESTVAPLSGQMLKGLAEGKLLATGGEPAKGMIWKTRLTAVGELAPGDTLMPQFELKQNSPHLLVLAFQTDSVPVNQLLFDIARYNFTNFLVKDFDLETITFNELSMLVIKGFDNFEELSEYRLRMSLPWGLNLPANVTPVMISDANFRLLLEGRTFDDYFSFMEQCTEAEVPQD